MQADSTDFFLPGQGLEVLEERNVLHLFLGQKSVQDLIYHRPPLDVIPATLTLSKLQKLTNDTNYYTYRLREGIAEIQDRYDFILIDTPGSSRFELQAALSLADLVIIPVTPSKWAIRAINLLLDEISATETLFSQKKQTAFLPVLFGSSKKHRDLLDRLKLIEEIHTLPEIPKSESIKTKTEKHEFLKKDTQAFMAFETLAEGVMSLIEPPLSYPLG